jgi:hypothetical protein
MAFVAVAIGVDNRDLDPVHEADRVDAHLTIVETVVDPFYSWSIENPGRVLKGNPVPADICGAFRRIPRKLHPKSLRNVFTHVQI